MSSIVSFETATAPDITAPVIQEGPNVVSVTDQTITVRWVTDEPADSGVSYNDGTVFDLVNDSNLVTEHLITISRLTSDTVYALAVSSTDTVGNGPVLGGPLLVTTASEPDTTPPIQSNIAVIDAGIQSGLAIV